MEQILSIDLFPFLKTGDRVLFQGEVWEVIQVSSFDQSVRVGRTTMMLRSCGEGYSTPPVIQLEGFHARSEQVMP